MDTPWKVQLLGGLRAEQGEWAIERFSTQKVGALLAYLAYHCDRPHPREILIELLWPGGDPNAGRQSLRAALYSLRRQIEPPGISSGTVITADRFSVQVNPDAVRTDVADFHSALESAKAAGSDATRAQCLAEAAELYRGELLPGFYQEWILTEQRRLADLYFDAVRRLTSYFEREKRWDRALDCARRAVAVDPLREEGHQDVMRLLAAADRPSEALRQYEDLERILKDELDAMPSAATYDLARKIAATGTGVQASSFSFRALGTTDGAGVAADPAEPSAAPSSPRLTGTVTFLLTEIEGAASLEHKAEAPFRDAVEVHGALLREAIQSHGGQVFKEGDAAFTAAFERASDALACAVECQRALAEREWPKETGELRVRMALDITELKPTGGEAAGGMLRRATGLLLAAQGGRILCSEVTAGLLRRGLESGVQLADLGFYRLRGIETPERLFAVMHPDAEDETARPPNATPAYASNLPLQFTRFFGREDELVRLEELVLDEETRLLTLTGPGGSGKTRLAIEAACQLFDAFRGAVWFVALQDISDPQLIADAILDALRLPRSPKVEPLEQVVEFLSRQPSLLAIDNYEQLVDEGGPAHETSAPKAKPAVRMRLRSSG